MGQVRLDALTKKYARGPVALSEFTLDIADGELIAIVGPSGCGKSTLLRLIAGLENQTSGKIWIAERRVDDLLPRDRNVSMMFQEATTFPHLTVAQNLGFGLRIRGTPRREVARRVTEAARILRLTDILDRRPSEISGGQSRRVAFGRAMLRHPDVLLLDEPFSNLDARLRSQMRIELSALHQRLGTTMLHVTHDQSEAMALGDRVAVLNKGTLEQVDTPERLYAAPATLFVAGFVGSPPMNLIEATVEDTAEKALCFGGFRIPSPADMALASYRGKKIVLGIRPSDLQDGALTDTPLPSMTVTARTVDRFGSQANIGFEVTAPSVSIDDHLDEEADPKLSRLLATVDTRTRATAGEPFRLALDPACLHLFDPETGRSLQQHTEA